MDLEIRGRIALVTGSHRGTGSAVARVLAAEGADVRVHGFEREAAERVASQIRAAGKLARAVAGDIRSDEGAARVAREAGAVDILVNSYGVAKGGSWESPADDWIDLYQENVLSGVRLVHALVPGMRARGWGRIVFLSTIGAARPAARMPHYYASKATLANLTLSLAKELAGTGITVNCVSPGIVATREVLESFRRRAEREGAPTDRASLERRILRDFMPAPAERVVDPEDVGWLVAFLVSERARAIDAADVRIDGGASDCV